MAALDDERGQSGLRLHPVFFTFIPEHCFAGHDRLLDAVFRAHRPRAIEDGEDLRLVPCRMPAQPAARRDAESPPESPTPRTSGPLVRPDLASTHEFSVVCQSPLRACP
jgi:hypothetical protein